MARVIYNNSSRRSSDLLNDIPRTIYLSSEEVKKFSTRSTMKRNGPPLRGSGEAKRSRSTETVSTTSQSEMGSRSNGRTVSGSNSKDTLVRDIANAMSPKIGRLLASNLTEDDINLLEEYLNKLQSQDVTPEVLEQTSIGKLVRMFENHQKLGPQATNLIGKWELKAHILDQASTSEVSSLTKANLISKGSDSSLHDMLVKLTTDVNKLTTAVNKLTTNVNKLTTNVKLVLDVTMPQRDRFFDKLHVT